MGVRVLLLVPVMLLGSCTAAAPVPVPPPVVVERGHAVEVGPMAVPRASHTATALADGQVLIVGGCTTPGCGGNEAGRRAELFDPATGKFRLGAPMVHARAGHTATRLLDGRVLITGGYPDEGRPPLAEAEIFDPKSGAFSATGALGTPRGAHTATLLADGRVLIVGGVSARSALSTVEVFNAQTGQFSAVKALPSPRATHGATRLSDGRVLIAGGQSVPGHGNGLLGTTVLYDPAADSWQEGPKLRSAKYKLAVAALKNGQALVIGGQTGDDAALRLRETEVFASNAFTPGPTMAEPRYKISDAVVVLDDGRIVVAGNLHVEVYEAGRFSRVVMPGNPPERQTPAAALLPGNRILVTGGYSEQTLPTASAVVCQL